MRGFGDVPRGWPEAEVDRPPRAGVAVRLQRLDDRIEIEHPLAEWSVGTGLVVVEGVVGIDEVDGADPLPRAIDEIDDAGDLLGWGILPRRPHAGHLGVTGIEHQLEVWLPYLVGELGHVARFVDD